MNIIYILKKRKKERKELVANKRPEPNGITGKLYQTYKEQLTAVLLKLFQRTEEEETHPKSSYEVTITLIQRYYIKKKQSLGLNSHRHFIMANVYVVVTVKIKPILLGWAYINTWV